MEKLAASLADAQVDLKPHQVEAALFAFRSPLSKGAILADDVGLGAPRKFADIRAAKHRVAFRLHAILHLSADGISQ